MPTAYEKAYGSVKFYEPDGTAIFDTEDDLGLWTSVDEEPSPDPKWVRVDVPGADGAVDLSRALAGQVTYGLREVTLGFVGSCADHAAALALVRQMRSALHGARVRVETVLTARIGGWYLADCECDGTAYAGGEVEVEVKAWADPFIRVGTQTLSLPGTTPTSVTARPNVQPSAAFLRGAGSLEASFPTANVPAANPQGATTAHLWWAMGANLLDVSRLTLRGWRSSDGISYTASPMGMNGQTITFGTVGGEYALATLTESARLGTSVDNSGIPFAMAHGSGFSGDLHMAIFLSGEVTAVSSPDIWFSYYISTTVGADGSLSGTSVIKPNTLATTVSVGSYSDGLVYFAAIDSSIATECVPTQAMAVQLYGITGTDLSVRLMLVGSPVVPTEWEAPELAYATVDFGGSWCVRKSPKTSDVATISPLGVTTTHHLAESANQRIPTVLADSYVTNGSISDWPAQGATRMCLSAVNAYGEECASNVIKMTSHAIATVTGSNSTMRSTPTVTSSGGMLLSIGGRDAIVGAGTQAVPSLTIPGGSFSVDYATFANATATMTWEGGVL